MNKVKICILWLVIALFLTACARPAAEGGTADGEAAGDRSGLTPEAATAYLAVVDELSAHLGFTEAEASEGECLHGGFVRDWDGDGAPELCLLLKTSPRDPDGWGGTPVYGWYPPTLYLYTFQNGRAVRAAEWDLYFAAGGREAVVAALTAGHGVRCVRWERDALAGESFVACFELRDGAVQKMTTSADVDAASQGADSARAFLDALGADKAQPLLYNNSGEVRLEGEANARELRAALAEKAS